MFDSENASSNSQVADGIGDILKRVRMNGPTISATGQGATGLQQGIADMLRQNRMYGPMAETQKPGRPPNLSYVPPIQTQDDQGKTIPKYRMGTGQRILGTLANFASGFAGHGGSPVYVGPGALNNRYYRDEAYREQQNQDVAQRSGDQYRNAIDYRTIGQDLITGKWKAKTYGGEMREIEAPPWAAPTNGEEEPNNNDAPVEQPPPEVQEERYMSTPARRRFAEIRKGKPYR